jgi:putative transposase
MIVFEAKLQGTNEQYAILHQVLRTARFVRNSCLRYWMDNPGKNKYDLNNYCTVLAKEYPWARKLNSMARQASAERAWSAISRFYENCKAKKPGKKGYPRFRKEQTHATVEYKTCGWKLSEDRCEITFTDGFKAGTFKMWGTRDLHYYQLDQIKRVRIVRRADGYYAQFCLSQDRLEEREPTGKTIGLDVGLTHFYTDSNGQTVENPRHLRKSEKALKRLSKKLSRTHKGSKNRAKARNRLSRKHLKVSRQRKDFAVKLARCVVQSNDLVAYEDLQVRNMVKNRRLSKSISDAAWSNFRQWLEYFGKVFGVATVAVVPHYTTQDCSSCRTLVKKSLSQRTHRCHKCGCVLDRDLNAAINILEKALRTVGHTGTNVAGCWSSSPAQEATRSVSGENDLCLSEEIPSSKPTRGKRNSLK